MEATRILIVEESNATREFLTELVQLLGFHAHPVGKKTDFLTQLHSLNPDLLILGTCRHPGQLKALAQVLHREKEEIPIVYFSESPEQPQAEPPFDLKNSCCLPRTCNPSQLKLVIERLIQGSRESDRQKLNGIIVGESPAILQVKKHIMRLAKSDVPVLITGESGTGKEIAARAIHDLSGRAKKPFIKVNSAAVPGTLLESELFGYERGAFTGAWQNKPGKFAVAHSGSILLDEIGEIPLHLQAKLLQVLQDGELSALGSTTTTKIDVRIFACTNANIARMVPDGRFRADLYYRLNVVNLHIPPLRERKDDLPLLCDHFSKKYAGNSGRLEPVITRETFDFFSMHSWPGNVRELENMIRRIFLVGSEEGVRKTIENGYPRLQHMSDREGALLAEGGSPGAIRSMNAPRLRQFTKEAARVAEIKAILDVLSYTRWNRKKTAQILQVSYKSLLTRIKEYRIAEMRRRVPAKDSASYETTRQGRKQ